ncbi:MAG: hypothetical protein FWD71_23220 [Oscillospiraceae bacterium]|nr:hypothetical protein [Oscillospiraceae bacterium]
MTAVLFITITVNNFYSDYEDFAVAAYIAELFIFAVLFLNGRIWEKLFVSTSLFGIITITAAVIIFILTRIFGVEVERVLAQEYSVVRLVMILITNIIFVYITGQVIKIKKQHNNVKKSDWVIFTFVPAVSIVSIIAMIKISLNTDSRIFRNIYIYVSLFSFLIINVVIYVVIKWRDRSNKAEMEDRLRKEKEEHIAQNQKNPRD